MLWWFKGYDPCWKGYFQSVTDYSNLKHYLLMDYSIIFTLYMQKNFNYYFHYLHFSKVVSNLNNLPLDDLAFISAEYEVKERIISTWECKKIHDWNSLIGCEQGSLLFTCIVCDIFVLWDILDYRSVTASQPKAARERSRHAVR